MENILEAIGKGGKGVVMMPFLTMRRVNALFLGRGDWDVGVAKLLPDLGFNLCMNNSPLHTFGEFHQPFDLPLER